jgi:hypothetical protein
MNKKGIIDTRIILIIIVIAGIISVTMSIRSNGQWISEETALCVSNKSTLVVSKTCGHCVEQKRILGRHLDKFEIEEGYDVLIKYNLYGVPAWIINDQVYYGVRSWNELKEITGC